MKTKKPTRYAILLRKERSLERLLSALQSTHVTANTLENFPGLAPLERIYITRDEGVVTCTVTICAGELGHEVRQLTELEEQEEYEAAQADHEARKAFRSRR